jgi:antitoxin HigA-1
MPMKNPPHPGRSIKNACMEPLGLNTTAAAHALGVPPHTLSRVLNGRASISSEMAIRLETAGWSSADHWIRLQSEHDLASARNEIDRLNERILNLESKNVILENENRNLRRRDSHAQGLRGAVFVAELTGGVLTRYKDGWDVRMANGTLIEVKFSRIHPQRRWTWDSLLGRNYTKIFDFLVLVGDKDERYDNRYPKDLGYVCFLTPRSEVNNIKNSWSNCQSLITNPEKARAPHLRKLWEYLVRSPEKFKHLSPNRPSIETLATSMEFTSVSTST